MHLLYHRPELLAQVDSHIAPTDFMDADLGSVYSLLLQFVPHGEDERWSQRLHEEASDKQDVLLAQLAVQALPLASSGDTQVMQDCLEKMRQRRYKFQLRQVKQRLESESDEAERQRLLEQATLLAKQRQPAAL